MISVVIDDKNEGGRLDKLLKKHLRGAPSGFIYKMLRKKNITLNGKKASGNELLKSGDHISLFFSEETYRKFTVPVEKPDTNDLQEAADRLTSSDHRTAAGRNALEDLSCKSAALPFSIVYEDENILLIDKPAGILSQRDQSGIDSANELCLKYLQGKGEEDFGKSYGFTPSVCNRLDRNTSGLLIFAKNYNAAMELSAALKERTIRKYYSALVKGKLKEEGRKRAYLLKDERTNTVRIFSKEVKGAVLIETAYRTEQSYGWCSLLSIELLTGKTHQIRAQLAASGTPILGDPKYGDPRLNRELKKKYGIDRQLLHAKRLIMPEFQGVLKGISGRIFESALPADFEVIMNQA